MIPSCPTCKDTGWLCEKHPDKPGAQCCGGPHKRCECNELASLRPRPRSITEPVPA